MREGSNNNQEGMQTANKLNFDIKKVEQIKGDGMINSKSSSAKLGSKISLNKNSSARE